jgi:hypothetical protein
MRWTKGYTQAELDGIQEKYNLVFPPDLVALYLDRQPLMGHDWINNDRAIRDALSWPLTGLLFDMRESTFWLPKWGERPQRGEDREDRMREMVAAAPKLIPIYSHRYLPETPNETGNPVLSVHQSDIIYYGSDLQDYFRREEPDTRDLPPVGSVKRITFWSDIVERSNC